MEISFCFIQILVKCLLWNVAHGTTAVLSLHVQNLVATLYPTLELRSKPILHRNYRITMDKIGETGPDLIVWHIQIWPCITPIIVMMRTKPSPWLCICFTTIQSHYVTGQYHLNSLRPRRDRRHFADDIFKCVFLNENEWISLRISLKFVPWDRINNIPSLVHIMAWRRPGVSEPMVVSLPTHICDTRPQWVDTTGTKLSPLYRRISRCNLLNVEFYLMNQITLKLGVQLVICLGNGLVL